MASPPSWICGLANDVANSLVSLTPMPPLGCHYYESDEGWEISIFPSTTEIVGGPEDGLQFTTPFYTNVQDITRHLSKVDSVTWQSNSFSDDDQLGAHLAIGGTYDGKPVSIRILKSAPSHFHPGRKVISAHGFMVETW